MATNILIGDCIEQMRTLPDESFDSIVTDPPYELNFMQRKWDSTGIAYNVDMWKECYRVLKPGGHLLSFGGSRTYHRMACAVEDAGFEIRDMLEWIFFSGFPKSLDVGKALDRMAGVERDIVGQRQTNVGMQGNNFKNKSKTGTVDITAPATEAAKKWDGFGTNLKPSHEPLVYAQKPLSVVPKDDIIRLNQAIGELICLLLSSANNVERLLMLSPVEKKGVSVSVHLIASLLHIKNTEKSLEKMGMFKSPDAAKIILSIAESWKIMLDASCKKPNTSTTKTVLGLTTALQTFCLLISQITQEAIAQEDAQTLGRLLSVKIVERGLKGPSAPCKKETFAQELVTFLTGRNIANIAEKSFMAVARAANSVLISALTHITTTEEKSEKHIHADIAAKSLKGLSVEAQNIAGSSACQKTLKSSPSHEPIVLARKKLIGTVAENVLKHGCGALNIGGCRIGTEETISNHSRSEKASISKGKYGDSCEQRTHQTAGQVLGRFPANLCHDGSDEVVGLFPVTSSGARKGPNPNVNSLNGEIYGRYRYCGGPCEASSGSAARFFFCAKAPKQDRNEGLEGHELKPGGSNAKGYTKDVERGIDRNRPVANHHPTVKPHKLMRWLCRLITPPGGHVLDPFMGSGSTGKAAIKEGFSFTGIDLDPEYAEIAKKRIEAVKYVPKARVLPRYREDKEVRQKPEQMELFT